jgi:hypothetical protein
MLVTMKNALRIGVPVGLFLLFSLYTLDVVRTHGLLGFLSLAGRERWGMQLLLDLAISLFVAGGWVRRDAKARGIVAWPYLVAMALLGSIGTLAYFVRRSFTPASRVPSA